MLRPQSFTADTFYYNSIDKQINTLYNLSDKLEDCNPVERPLILYRIQHRVNKMWQYNFDLITGKEMKASGVMIPGNGFFWLKKEK